MKFLSTSFYGLLTCLFLACFISCQESSDTSTKIKKVSPAGEKMRDFNDALFISHEGIAKAVTKQLWKEIVFGDYNVEDLKLFNLGKQTSKLGDEDPFQIITYGYQIQGDPEIFRVSLRSDLKGDRLTYQLNEENYYTCTEAEYDPNLYSIEMKIAVSKLMADDFLKRKILELER